MNYISTRDHKKIVSSAEAICQGLSSEGGLYVPENIPKLDENEINFISGLSYQKRSAYLMKKFLDDYSLEELMEYTEKAYSPEKFDTPYIAPVRSIDESTAFLELWHGPTCAFKDLALQILPYIMSSALIKTKNGRDVCILTATSGDTGKAAMEGFKDVPRTKIIVFYPESGVSEIQRIQMITQEGSNVVVAAIRGNFDEAQSSVKKIFSDRDINYDFDKNGWILSSANSINLGRLIPQIVYYFSSYCDLVNAGCICNGEKINFCVPSGNFGNILAGYYAKRSGLPVNKFICASNSNNVLTDFINDGIYNINRKFYNSISPAMDVLIPSNVERLIFHLSGNDKDVLNFINSINKSGKYTVSSEILSRISSVFSAESCNDIETMAGIKDAYDNFGYLIDPHTAVASRALKKYRTRTGDSTYTVVVSTASPFKFADSVMRSLQIECDGDKFCMIDKLAETTGTSIPKSISELKNKKPKFDYVIEKDEVGNFVRKSLDIF